LCPVYGGPYEEHVFEAVKKVGTVDKETDRATSFRIILTRNTKQVLTVCQVVSTSDKQLTKSLQQGIDTRKTNYPAIGRNWNTKKIEKQDDWRVLISPFRFNSSTFKHCNSPCNCGYYITALLMIILQ
jgi:hypothetical protein